MIYFIRQYNEYVKIGTSINIEERLNNLQTANPKNLKVCAVLEGNHKTEKGLHELFQSSHVRGEWFRFDDNIKWFVRAVQENPQMLNIFSLYKKSQQMKILDKAKRLKKKGNPKLFGKIQKIIGDV